MNIVNDIWEFGKAHSGAFAIAFAWAVREWTTVRGWQGLKRWWQTGSVKAPEVPKS